jgi:hypothetical protein
MQSGDILLKLRALKPTFEKMGLKRVRVFGSVLHGTAGEHSDVDLLVDFYKTPGLLELANIKIQFEDYIGRPVDLLLPEGIHPLIKDSVLAEARDV